MRRIFCIFTLATAASFPLISSAAILNTCVDAFERVDDNAPEIGEQIWPLSNDHISDFARELFAKNIDFYRRAYGFSVAEPMKNFRIERPKAEAHDDAFSYYSAWIQFEQGGGQNFKIPISIRSNGYAALVNESGVLFQKAMQNSPTEKPGTFQAVARIGASKFVSADQNSLVLENIGSEVVLARAMSRVEHLLWRSRQSHTISIAEHELSNRANGPEKSLDSLNSESVPSVSFALNDLNRSGRLPIKIRIPLVVLKDLSRQGLLVINTQSGQALDHKIGLPREARAPFGVEIEFVFIGKKTLRLLERYF